MKTNGFGAVVFDFDYTLADSSHGVIECINFALGEMGLDHVSYEAACRTIGLSLSATFLALGEHHEPHRCNEFHQLFIRRADDVMVNLTNLYDSVPATIDVLRQRGLRLGIVSTKYRRRINEVLIREALLDRFQIVIGGEDVEEHKPHPQGLLRAIDELKCPTPSVLYVGDSVVDAEVARRAGVPLVVVLTGTTSRDEFDNYDPLAMLDSISELPEFLVFDGAEVKAR